MLLLEGIISLKLFHSIWPKEKVVGYFYTHGHKKKGQDRKIEKWNISQMAKWPGDSRKRQGQWRWKGQERQNPKETSTDRPTMSSFTSKMFNFYFIFCFFYVARWLQMIIDKNNSRDQTRPDRPSEAASETWMNGWMDGWMGRWMVGCRAGGSVELPASACNEWGKWNLLSIAT